MQPLLNYLCRFLYFDFIPTKNQKMTKPKIYQRSNYGTMEINRSFDKEELRDLSNWLKVLCEPNRLLLLEQIIQGVQCNCELGKTLDMAPNLVSHHLKVLQEAGIIKAERNPLDSRWIVYTINEDSLDMLHKIMSRFLDRQRIMPRKISCGPKEKVN